MAAEHRRCFVIMPFGQQGSKDKAHYDEVYEHVIKRALEPIGIECVRADRMGYSGEITTEVLRQLHDAELVLADLSDSKPNVFYELGYRHALRKPTIMIRDDIDDLPFNVSTRGMILYTLTVPVLDHARDEIRRRAEQALAELRLQAEPEPAEPEPDVRGRLRSLEFALDTGLETLYRLMTRSMPLHQALERNAEEQGEMLRDVLRRIDSVPRAAAELVSASTLLQKTSELGLVGIHATRLDAIEEEFFAVMQREKVGIDLVGSTIFGARGHHRVTRTMVLALLAEKAQRPGFELRMLLTHPDFISHRQDQERSTKSVDRIFISAELKDAVDWLIQTGLTHHARFYRGAPTCFMVTCRGEKMMLANPYPYQYEAYNSWTAVFRETPRSGVYDQFGEHHFEEPWSREDLAVPFSDGIVEAVERRLQEDIAKAHREMARWVPGERSGPT